MDTQFIINKPVTNINKIVINFLISRLSLDLNNRPEKSTYNSISVDGACNILLMYIRIF